MTVPEPAAGTTTARVRFLLQRTSDRASDAVQMDLPIRPDRPVVHRRDLLATGPGGALDIPRPGGSGAPRQLRADRHGGDATRRWCGWSPPPGC